MGEKFGKTPYELLDVSWIEYNFNSSCFEAYAEWYQEEEKRLKDHREGKRKSSENFENWADRLEAKRREQQTK